MKRNYLLLIIVSCFLSHTSFSQEKEFQIMDSLKNKEMKFVRIEVFPISELIINSKKFEYVDSINPIYKEKLELIENLVKDSLELEGNQKDYISNSLYLKDAMLSMQKYLDERELPLIMKLNYLKEAQSHLDKTNTKIIFYTGKKDLYTACGGKSDFEISQYVREGKSKIDKIIREGENYEYKQQRLKMKIVSAKQELSRNQKILKVLKETGIVQRTILKVNDQNIGKEITGIFVKEVGAVNEYGQSTYWIMKQDFRQFVKNELVIKDTIEKYTNNIRDIALYAGGFSDYLIKKTDTGKLYYTTGDILKDWGMDYAVVQFYAQIDRLNIHRKNIDDKVFLYLNGYQCVLTNDIVPELLNNDISCIKRMSESVNKYKEFNKIASDLAIKISNYIRQYRSLLLRGDDLNEWKKNTSECDFILNKMHNLPYANSEFYNEQLDREIVMLNTSIQDLIQYSKNKLGL